MVDSPAEYHRWRRGCTVACLACAVLASVGLGTGCGIKSTVPADDSSGTGLAADSVADVPVPQITSALEVPMALLPGGTFTMGSDLGAADESPRHNVTLSPFAIDIYEMTQDLLAKLEQPNPAHFKGPRRPIEQIRWSEAALLCNARSIAEGLEPCYDEATFACNMAANGYRLPTEAEWEYAARAGSSDDTPGPRGNSLKSYACYAASSQKRTDPVGSRRPNAFGLHDMLGNVAEWCHDVYAADYYGQSPAQDPTGPTEGSKRVLRGGSWKSDESSCRVSTRAADDPGISDACFARDNYGFRCVRRLSAEELAKFRP